MSDFEIVSPQSTQARPTSLPAIRGSAGGVSIRPAVQDDFAFVDRMQKHHKGCLGFQYEQAIRTRIDKGQVLVAESGTGVSPVGSATHTGETPVPLGYIMGQDRYFKRDEVGLIIQLAVAPGSERRLIGAHLLRAQFDNSAYGCRLYCCWCAQDLAANRFWEAMGFVPLAFRTGGGRHKKDGPRMHIFWQKRIRDGDVETPYWFPSLTGAGQIGEDRIVLPIPPGTHWSDAKPIVLPEGPMSAEREREVLQLESEVEVLERERRQRVAQRKKAKAATQTNVSAGSVETGGLRFGPSRDDLVAKETEAAAEREVEAELKAAKRAAKKAKQKFDPAQEAFARELKDRWLETVQARPALLADLEQHAKYDVRRLVAPAHGSIAGPTIAVDETKRLAA